MLAMPVKRFANEIFNALPDRVNMFGRYMTGFGGDGLELDKSTEKSLVAATEKKPYSEFYIPELAEGAGGIIKVPAMGPGVPMSGPVSNPYFKGAKKDAAQTLGRFNAQVSPQTVRITDTYDMVNEFEDPDLTSGKFQPKKGINNLIAAFDHNKEINRQTGELIDVHNPSDQQSHNRVMSKRQNNSPTQSKATELGRSLMYFLPIKPKAYDVDYTIKR
tara:strand:+ start:76 stop:729 length:654 start_codon:yes stop_codon:yes gene_type:complete